MALNEKGVIRKSWEGKYTEDYLENLSALKIAGLIKLSLLHWKWWALAVLKQLEVTWNTKRVNCNWR